MTSPDLNPDPLQGVVAELSKRLDSIETHQREDIAALRQEVARWMRGLIGIGITGFLAITGLLVTILLKLANSHPCPGWPCGVGRGTTPCYWPAVRQP